MSEQTLDNTAATGAAPAPQEDHLSSSLAAAVASGNTWKFEGQHYARFVANRTGTVGISIMHPVDKQRKIALLGADFLWTEDNVFLDHLNLKIRDERNVRDEETQRKRANIITQNALLFADTVQSGWLDKIDTDGTPMQEPSKKTRDQMLAYAPEIQSDIVDAWLGHFAVERYFPNGTDDVDALLSEPESVFFAARVGDYKSPAHVMVFEFNVPTAEQRRAFETDTLIGGTRTEGDTVITNYMVNNKAKLKFCRKHLKGVDGASIGPDMTFDFDDSEIRPATDLKEFSKLFNPNWQIRLADALADCFNFGGK